MLDKRKKMNPNQAFHRTAHKVRRPVNADVRRENMKHIFIVLGLLICATCGYAESRTIGVYVAPLSNAEVRVTILSDVQAENRNDLTVSQACAILGNAQSWGAVPP